MGKPLNQATLGAVSSGWLSSAFIWLALVGEKISMNPLIGQILWPVGFVLDGIGLTDALYKTWQDVRDWYLIQKRLKEFKGEHENKDKRLEDLILSWEKGEDGSLDKQRAARARELIGPWNIVRNSLINLMAPASKLSAMIGCGLFSAAMFGVVGIFPWAVPLCFTIALGLGTGICAVKAVDVIRKLKKNAHDKAAGLQLAASLFTGAACLTACAAVVTGLLIPAITLGGGIVVPAMIGGAIAATVMFAIGSGAYVASKVIARKNRRQNVGSEADVSKVEETPLLENKKSTVPSLLVAMQNKNAGDYMKARIKIAFDGGGLFWKNKHGFTRDAYEAELKTACETKPHQL